MKANIPVWEMLLHEMAKPGRVIRWEHVLAHVNVQGNKVGNGLALKGMCDSLLWSRSRRRDSSSSKSTMRLQEGSWSRESKGLWDELGLHPMDGEERIGEAPGGREGSNGEQSFNNEEESV